MTTRDDDLPDSGDIVERALRESSTQEIHLAPETSPGDRALVERAVDAVQGVERVETLPLSGAEELHDTAALDGVPPDIAEAYRRAKAEVDALLAAHRDSAVRDPKTI